jgi:hypothetical protein
MNSAVNESYTRILYGKFHFVTKEVKFEVNLFWFEISRFGSWYCHCISLKQGLDENPQKAMNESFKNKNNNNEPKTQ